MNKKMLDALETCLQALDNGETIDSALKRFPALADELRPILEASRHARSLAGEPVADEVHRRGRAKLLQRAAELRESKRASRKRTWVFAFRPVAITLMLVVFLLSGTSLVRASSTSLPGDNLYPVKRTWEDFTLIFTSGLERDDLELTYETERVEEIQELLAEGRGEVVTFSGYVNTQTTSQWTVAGVPVLITSDTVLPAEPIVLGSGVTISGTTNELGFLVAQNVEIVPAGTVIPDLDDDAGEDSSDEEDDENENGSLQNPSANGDSANPSNDDAGESDGESSNPETKLKGVLEAANGKLWVVNGQNVDVSHAEIVGTPAAGAVVTIEGFYDANGIFVATKVVFSSAGEGDGSTDSDGGNNLSNGNDNNDNENDNDENDNDSNDNGDDNNNNDGGGNDNGGDD